MKIKAITFSNEDLDPYGIPQKYHRYVIFVGPQGALGNDKYVATIWPITDAPKPSYAHFVADSEDVAVKNAFEALRNLPENQGLRETIDN